MQKKLSGNASAGSDNQSNIEAAAVRPPARTHAERAPDGRTRGEDAQGTSPTIRVPSKYIPEEKPVCRVLRCAVDSLYLSYKGELSNEVDDRLEDRKKSAQSDDDEEQSIAQIVIADRLFNVSPHGAGHFRYIITDERFRIQISHGKKLPLAYAKISSEYLTFNPVEKIEEELRIIVNSLGNVHEEAKVSRADVCVDFIPGIPMDEFNVRQWVTRARKKPLIGQVGIASPDGQSAQVVPFNPEPMTSCWKSSRKAIRPTCSKCGRHWAGFRVSNYGGKNSKLAALLCAS